MALSGIFDGFAIATSGMKVQRAKMNVIASNIANADTMESSDGGPYRKQTVSFKSQPARSFSEIFSTRMEKFATSPEHFTESFSSRLGSQIGEGVKVADIKQSDNFTTVYDPSSPYANEEGFVKKPDINTVEEMVDLIEAQRAFEANATSFNSIKAMMKKSLEII